MRPLLLGAALATLVACGAAPGGANTPSSDRNDLSRRDNGNFRSDSYSPAREPAYSSHGNGKSK